MTLKTALARVALLCMAAGLLPPARGAQTPTVAQEAATAAPVWAEPTKAEPAGTRYRTFHSKIIKGQVSYLLYLPPDYETNTQRRYPVVYWLHGLGGNQRTGAGFVERLDAAIQADRAPVMIAVLVNSPRASMYCDSADGNAPAETVFIRELIPHVDATYRTIARREARAVEGFSMGGFGAARLGFKYPQLFGVVSILAGALHTAESLAERRAQIFREVFGASKEYYDAQSPWTLLEKNAGAVRGKTHVRIWVGDQDQLHDWNRQYYERLKQLGITAELEVVPGVGHNYRQLYEKIGERAFAFYSMALGRGRAAAPAGRGD